jgi:hypothetical protein
MTPIKSEYDRAHSRSDLALGFLPRAVSTSLANLINLEYG